MLDFNIKSIDAAFIERHKTHGFEDPQLVELLTAFKSEHIPTTVVYVKCSSRNTYIYGCIKNGISIDTTDIKTALKNIVESNAPIAPDNIYNECDIRFHFQRYLN